MYGHGLLPTPEYDDWRRRCLSGDSLAGECEWEPWDLWETMVGDSNINMYALSYPLCSPELQAPLHRQRFRLLDTLLRRPGVAFNRTRLELLYEPCREDYMTTYLNRGDVRAALHVPHGITWESCNDPLFYNYSIADQEEPQEPRCRPA